MTAGLPGTGIGGVFYLLSALLMPLVELVKTLRGQSSKSRWLLVIRQLAMASGIIAGMWMLGIVLGLLLETQPDVEIARIVNTEIAVRLEQVAKLNVFHIAPVIMSMLTLTLIIVMTNVLRLFYRPADRQ